MVDTTSFRHLYPFESRWLDLDGLRYHYLDQGPRDAPAVLLLHGNPTWSFYYRTLIPDLSQSYRVIAPDHMGCGLSDKPQNYAYTLAQHIQNLERLLEQLGLARLTLALHDWGGAIGMGYAVRHAPRVAGLVIFNTAAFFVPALPKRIRLCRVPCLGDLLVRGLNGFVYASFLFATSQRARLNKQVRAGYLAPYNNWRNRAAILRFVQDIPLEADHPTRATLDAIEAGLPQFRQRPAIIFWGADDFCFTARDFLPRWRERLPQAEVHLLADAGHYVVEDAHERIIPDMLCFLQRVGETTI